MKKLTRVLAVMLVCTLALAALVACAPNSDPDKALASLKKNNYVATKATDAISLGLTEAVLKLQRGDIVASVTGSAKDDNGNQSVTIIYCKDASAAKTALKSAQELHGDEADDMVVAQSGKIVYWGTKAAIKAAR